MPEYQDCSTTTRASAGGSPSEQGASLRAGTNGSAPESRAIEVRQSYCSWTDLLGASEGLATIGAGSPNSETIRTVERIARFHETVRGHSHYFAPALIVSDGVAQVVTKGDRWWERPRELLKRVALMHYAACVEDTGPGCRTTVCQGMSIVTGPDRLSSYGGLSFRAASEEPDETESEEWERWYENNASTFGAVHCLAVREFQLNLAFAKAWECNGRLTHSTAKMFVESSILDESLEDAHEKAAFESPDGICLTDRKLGDAPKRRVTLDDFIGAIRRAPGEANVGVRTKIGGVDLIPIQARCFRPRKLFLKEWRALWEEHGKDRVSSDPAFLYLEPEPPWK